MCYNGKCGKKCPHCDTCLKEMGNIYNEKLHIDACKRKSSAPKTKKRKNC